MRAIETEDLAQVREFYQHFAQVEAPGHSELYAQWAAAVADDDETLALLMEVPAQKRQPNLLFAAARVHEVPLAQWAQARKVLFQRWDAVRKTMLARRTQTNEAGRIAVLNYAFSRIAAETDRPLALIEVGCAAGLCLYPDAWPIRYRTTDHDAAALTTSGQLAPSGPLASAVELVCELDGVQPPARLPEVAWRAGIDLNPLDLTEDANIQWLQALIWPGMEYRLERITAGAELVAADPPQLFTGDLNETLPGVLAQVPEGTQPVVFHSAVLAYLSREDRARFVEQVSASKARWVSNEGLGVLPEIRDKLPGEDPNRSGFILALDGEPLARTGPHGQYLRALQR